jgi:hypothetical protein
MQAIASSLQLTLMQRLLFNPATNVRDYLRAKMQVGMRCSGIVERMTAPGNLGGHWFADGVAALFKPR